MDVHGWPETAHEFGLKTGGEPLEDGRDITDHAVPEQDRLRITGIVSNFDGTDRVRAAVEDIRRNNKERAIYRVITEWGEYEEMLMVRASASYWGRGARIECEMQEILRVSVGTTPELTSETASGPANDRTEEVNRGKAPLGDTEPATPAPPDPGLAAQLGVT